MYPEETQGFVCMQTRKLNFKKLGDFNNVDSHVMRTFSENTLQIFYQVSNKRRLPPREPFTRSRVHRGSSELGWLWGQTKCFQQQWACLPVGRGRAVTQNHMAFQLATSVFCPWWPSNANKEEFLFCGPLWKRQTLTFGKGVALLLQLHILGRSSWAAGGGAGVTLGKEALHAALTCGI